MITPGERNGVKGNYLDAMFCPVFFPDTPEGNAALGRWIDSDIRFCKFMLGFMAVGSVLVFGGIPLLCAYLG